MSNKISIVPMLFVLVWTCFAQADESDAARAAESYKNKGFIVVSYVRDGVWGPNDLLSMYKNMDSTGMCYWLHSYLDSVEKIEKLADSAEQLTGFDGVSMIEWEEVSGEQYKKIAYEKMGGRDPRTYGDASENFKNWEQRYKETGGAKFYLAELNYDNQGDNEKILRYESNMMGFGSGEYFVLDAELEPLPGSNGNKRRGRLFAYKNLTYVIEARVSTLGDYSITIKKMRNTGGTRAMFNNNRVCQLANR